MNVLSEEQAYILNNVKEGKNVVVDAVAGTGKTTIILAIAGELSTQNILQLTYNSSLRVDVKNRAVKLGLSNLSVHTFHSLAVRYYLDNAFTDTELRRIVNNNIPPKKNITIEKIDILVLDESQDFTFVYFQFMVKFVKDMGSPVQLLILGDYMQGIYDFKGADARFLTLANTIWSGFSGLKTNEFIKCKMTMSYRITNQMCAFVNNVMLGENRMRACRDDQPVVYIRNGRYNSQTIVLNEIKKLFEQGIKPDEIFILGASVRGENSNIRRLENRLVENDVSCYVSISENDKIDERAIEKKVVFSTFHCVKGRERKYVFVMGFDNSYYTYYQRDKPNDVCANTLYVATTRAEKGLFLLENNENMYDCPLRFLKKDHIEMKKQDYIEFRGMHQSRFFENRVSSFKDTTFTTPTELIKFLPESVIEEITRIMEKIFITEIPANTTIDIPSIIQTRTGLYEEVSDLNGIAIPCMYYDDFICSQNDNDNDNKKGKGNSLRQIILNEVGNIKENRHTFLKQKVAEIPETIDSIEDYLYLATLAFSIQEKLYFRLKQIDRYDYTWLKEEDINKCKERLHHIIDPDCQNSMPIMEETIIRCADDYEHVKIDAFLKEIFENNIFRFTARVDTITENTIWEIKCTSKLTIDHMLQVVIYAWIWRMRNGIDLVHSPNKEFKLFNIKTGEVLRLDATIDELHTVMIAILKGKYQKPVVKTDEEFVADCKTYLDKIQTTLEPQDNSCPK